jgi:DNA-binding MarR family transcriptional regulator
MPGEVYEKLARLQWLLHRQHLRARAEGGPMADTTRGQGRILALLKLQDGVSTKDLSYLLGMAISSLTELLLKLEKGGFITREPLAQDKRVMLVKLTAKGREEQPADHSGNIFACLSPEEQKIFVDCLDRISAALQAEIGEDEEAWRQRAAAHARWRERMGAMTSHPDSPWLQNASAWRHGRGGSRGGHHHHD